MWLCGCVVWAAVGAGCVSHAAVWVCGVGSSGSRLCESCGCVDVWFGQQWEQAVRVIYVSGCTSVWGGLSSMSLSCLRGCTGVLNH